MEDSLTVQNSNPANLIKLAIETKADITQLEKLMELQERWEKKEARKAFFDALSKFQTMVPILTKKKTARITPKDGKPAFQYKYADLASISQDIKKPLNECGLSYRWEFKEENNVIKCTCLLSHRDGHTETTSMEAGKDNSGAKNDIQQKGSTQTYLQRYTLIGALGLSTADSDNDGKGTKQAEEKPKQTEEEYLEQWQCEVDQCKTKIQLNGLYAKNQRTILSDKRIQEIFKKKQDELKATDLQTEKVQMP